MSDLTMRRADFMMVLAYASDLATGHSRDFALRSCALGMRLADLAGFDEQGRRNVYPRRFCGMWDATPTPT